MISIEVIRDNNSIVQISSKGHSGYEDIGKDIVCSSVSTLMIYSINLLEKMNVNFEYKVDEKEVMMSIIIKTIDAISDSIMETLLKCLEDLSSQYKKFINIRK